MAQTPNRAKLAEFNDLVKTLQMYTEDQKSFIFFAQTIKKKIAGRLDFLHKFNAPKSVFMIPVNGVIDLPEDFIRLVKVGICCNGKIITIGHCDAICPPKEVQKSYCNCETVEEACEQVASMLGSQITPSAVQSVHDNPNYLPPTEYDLLVTNKEALGTKPGCSCGVSNCQRCVCFHGCEWSGSGIGERYGAGHGYDFLGFYRYDRENCQLIFCEDFRLPQSGTLIIEYIPSTASGGLELFPLQWWDYLENYALSRYYRLRKRDPSIANGFAQEAKQIESGFMRQVRHDYHYDDIMRAITRNQHTAVK